MTTTPESESPAAPLSVEEARSRVAEANQNHYALLEQREKLTAQIRDNAAALAERIDELAAAEQAAKPTPDLTGEAAPPDPPPTTVPTGQVADAAKAGA